MLYMHRFYPALPLSSFVLFLYFLLTNLYLHFFFEKEKQTAIEDLKSLNRVK